MIIYLLSAWFVFPLAARPFYVTGCHSVSLFIPLDESEAYVSDIVRGEVSLHLRNGNLCAFTCVCTSCQMGVYDSTAGGITSSQKQTQTIQRPLQTTAVLQHQSTTSTLQQQQQDSSASPPLFCLPIKHCAREKWKPDTRQLISFCLFNLSRSHSSLGGSFLFSKIWLLTHRQ